MKKTYVLQTKIKLFQEWYNVHWPFTFNNLKDLEGTKSHIKKLYPTYELIYPDGEIDFDKYNSDNPYDILTFGRGFYDISFVESDDEDEYAGCIMIFEL